MKKLNVIRMLNFRSFALAGIFAFAVFAVSCSKEDEIIASAEPVVEEATEKSGKAVKKGDLSIAEIALLDDGEFDELVAALQFVDAELNAGLVDLFLNGKDQFTVFAPTDAAFAKLYGVLGVGSIDELDPQLVLNVLLYHVTEGRRGANSVVPKRNLRTITTLLDGATFKVNPDGKIIAVGNAAMIGPSDISASNGIIHVIDAVLLPIAL